MAKQIQKLSFNLPMWLTWARIAFIPLIVGVFMLPISWVSMEWQNIIGCALFIIAAITDAL
ncbi:CDP-alcohol phosphatidyltransferase family protein, partial [Turicimonas muris]